MGKQQERQEQDGEPGAFPDGSSSVSEPEHSAETLLLRSSEISRGREQECED